MCGVTGCEGDISEQGVEVPECVVETVVSSVVKGLNSSRNLGGGRCGAANGAGALQLVAGAVSFRAAGGAA